MSSESAPILEVAGVNGAALRLLRDAWECAATSRLRPHEFALEIDEFYRAGITVTELRCLILEGLTECVRDETKPNDTARRFRPVKSLAFGPAACFVLTQKGYHRSLTAGNGQSGHQSSILHGQLHVISKPHWDAKRRELLLGARLIKRFRTRAGNQEKILLAFEEEGWPESIDNPLPPNGSDSSDRLQAAIKRLNRHQFAPLLRFHGTGEQAICWNLL